MRTLFKGLLALLLFSSCIEKPNIVGLWEITSVAVGNEDMTPNGRWMRFHENKTQESGNGWLQHSEGTWELDPETNALSIVNTNGINDAEVPFTISLSANEMTWTRMEDGQEIQVSLQRATKIPKINSDALFGLWSLENASGNGEFFTSESNGGLFFRWDKRFEMYTPEGKIHGVYNVHGHKPEVELIPYGDKSRSWWHLEVDETSLNISLLNSDTIVTRRFKRIYEFPN